MLLVHYLILGCTTALVGILGARLCRNSNSTLGAGAAVLLYASHPLVLHQNVYVSAWDGLIAVLFFAAWVWMEEWSLFMRSWILSGIYAFALWLGSAFIWWIPLAMLPWMALSRRPLNAFVKLVTIVLGGLALFGVVWGGVAVFAPARPPLPWSYGFRWSYPHVTVPALLPFLVLTAEAIFFKIKEAVKSRRADGGLAIALLLGIVLIFGPPEVDLALIALACPLIALTLVRREFVYQRAVRWIMAYTFGITLVLMIALHQPPGWTLMLTILATGGMARGVQKSSILSWRESLEASCLGAHFAVAIGSALVPAMR